MSNITRKAQDFIRQFSITPFGKFLPAEKIKTRAKGIKKIRDRKVTIVFY